MFSLPQVTVGDTAVTLYALLALLFCLLGAAAGAVCLKRRGWKTGPALLFGLALGRCDLCLVIVAD